MAEKKTNGFDLGAVLAGVSKLDTAGPQLQQINLARIHPDPKNFYTLSGLEDLAANIATVGLLDPLNVRPDPDHEGEYIVISGHRRRAAIQMLVEEDGRSDLIMVPCLVHADPEDGEPEALRQLRLIFANSSTRQLTSAETAQQAQQVEELLYELKECGMEFDGRMRDHVAEAVKVSKSRLARLKVIRACLIPKYKELWERDVINESVAYELARLPGAIQSEMFAYGPEPKSLTADQVKWKSAEMEKIHKVDCKLKGGKCQEAQQHLQKQFREPGYSYCSQCCQDCTQFLTCSFRCPLLEDKAKARRAEKKAAKAEERERIKSFDEKRLHMVRTAWKNFAAARAHAGKSMEEVRRDVLAYAGPAYLSRLEGMENPAYDYKPGTEMPFRGTSADYVQLSAIADELGVTTDYLLGRTPEDRAQLAYKPGDSVPEVGKRLTFDDLVGMVGQLVVYDIGTSRKIYRVIRIVEITMSSSGNRRLIYRDGGRDKCYINEEYFNSNAGNQMVKMYALPVPGDEMVEEEQAPGSKWLHLSFVDALHHPVPDEDMLALTRTFYCLFDCGDSKATLPMVAKWVAGDWCFPGGSKIDAKCLKYFPLPRDENGGGGDDGA